MRTRLCRPIIYSALLLSLLAFISATRPVIASHYPHPEATVRPARGAADARLVITFFDDPQCAHSARAYHTMFEEVLPSYADRVSVTVKELPNSAIHRWAKRAAINASCLSRQSAAAYWEFSDYVRAHQGEIARDPDRQLDALALAAARDQHLDPVPLQECLNSQPDDTIKAAFAEARAAGVTVLPTLLIGGKLVEGALPAADLRDHIDRALRSTSPPTDRPPRRARSTTSETAGHRGTSPSAASQPPPLP